MCQMVGLEPVEELTDAGSVCTLTLVAGNGNVT